MYGVSTSPILHEKLLILVLDDDANLPDSQFSRSKVIALDKATGEPVWETGLIIRAAVPSVTLLAPIHQPVKISQFPLTL